MKRSELESITDLSHHTQYTFHIIWYHSTV